MKAIQPMGKWELEEPEWGIVGKGLKKPKLRRVVKWGKGTEAEDMGGNKSQRRKTEAKTRTNF